MFGKPHALKAVALCAILAFPALGNNLFVLPTFTGNATASATVYSGNPLTPAGTFTTASDAFLVLARPTQNAADTKYYVISRSGSSSLVILNSALTPVGTPISFGQNVTAAAITPDGKYLLVVAGNLRVYNTADDSEVRSQFLDVGLNPNDIAVSQDSTRAFVMSAQGQKITAVDLTSFQIAGNIPLPAITSGFATMSPNGLLYVSAQNRVLEIDPRANPFDSNAVRRQFTFAGANLTKLQFTPDGTRAIAGNTAPQSGQALIYFSFDFVNPQTALVTPTDSLSGVLFDKVFVAGNDRAYAVASNTSGASARKMFQLQLPVAPVTGALQPPVVTDSFFGSLGNIPIVDSVVFSREYPQAQRMFISAPLNLLQQAAQNTIYTANLTSNPPNVTGQFPITFLPGPLNFAGPAQTILQESPSGIIPINSAQPNVGLSGRTLPFGVRVLGASGLPLYGIQVVFTPTTPGVTLVGNATGSTNVNGIAMITAQAPATAGPFSVSVSIGSSGLSTGFSFTAGGSTGGGGGGGTGGASLLTVLTGDGQVVTEGNESRDVVVRLLDSNAKPVVGATVTWAVSQGLSRFTLGSVLDDQGRMSTLTDSNGRSTNRIRAQIVEINKSTSQSVMTVTAGDQTATLYFTSALSTSSGGIAPFPSANFQSPNEQQGLTGKAGQVIPGAIVAQVVTSTGNELGQVIPNVGMEVRVDSLPGTVGPGAECTPKPIPLGNELGIITCDLKLTGRAGTGTLVVTVGGYTERKYPLRVEPGEPTELKILNGNTQFGDINQLLPAALVVELGDGGGNTLGSATIRWEVIQGQATLTNSTTVTDNNGRASNTLRLGSSPGVVLVRATALGGTQPTVTFEARVNVTVAGLIKVSGDPQTTFTNSAFANPLVVQVLDNRQAPVPGVTVNFTVGSGSAILSSATATTDTNGRAQVSARAGANAGPIVIQANTPGVAQGVTFSLTAQLPGPVPGAFLNAASGQRGSVVPGGIYTLQGSGFAPDLRGCIEGVPIVGQLPTRLNQVELQFGSNLAPIFSVCNLNGVESVTFQAPFELSPGFPVSLIARVGAGSTTINNVQVLDYQPGTFETADAQGRRYAVALRPDGTFVTPDNPARYGEIVRVYITGAGQVAPTAMTGATGTAGQKVAIDVVVGLNDQGVRVVSAEYAQGMVGVYEIKFEVPQGTQTGATRPLGILLVRSNGQFIYPENSPTIAIAP